MTSIRPAAWGLCALALVASVPARGQRESPAFESLEALREDYARKARELDRRQVLDLADLAARLRGEEAEAAYGELFSLAIAGDLYAEAEPAALRCAKEADMPIRLRAQATFVGVIARANRGEPEESLADLVAFLDTQRGPEETRERLDDATVFALGEAYLQRLMQARRYDLARKLGEIAERRGSPAVREHFAGRLARLAMVGRPAPPLSGLDVDGRPVRLSDLKGKVVLVDFWAAWCPPCVEAFPERAALLASARDRGFAILGVNLDARRRDVGSVEKARPIVRRFLLDRRADWPNILVGGEGDDPASAYGVAEIPANFLVGRDGTIVGVELEGEALEAAVEEALRDAT